MNAPRQGLFASLLLTSFVLHVVLIVVASNYFLKDTRADQGGLLTRQLATDSLSDLSPPNTVALALLASRYATNPNIASLRILDVNNTVLATAGNNKTRDGDVFVRDALSNEQKVGRVEVTLIKPSIGENLRNQWFALLVSFLIHALLWLGYRMIARPTRSEFLEKMKRESALKHEIQRLADALEQEKHQSALAIAKVQQMYQKPKLQNSVDQKKASEDDAYFCLSIQFYDPKQLLATVNQGTAQTFFNLLQLLLSKTIQLCQEEFQLEEGELEVWQRFCDDGAMVRVNKTAKNAIPAIIQASFVFQLLSDALYQRYREEKRFRLQTRSAVSESCPNLQLTSDKAAMRLVGYLHAKETAIYLSRPSFKEVRHCYNLVSLPDPSNVLMREAFLLQGVNSELAKIAETMRNEVLLGRKPSDAESE